MLPGALEELTELSRLRAGSSFYAGTAFDRESILRALSAGTPVHIATHLRPGCGENRGYLADAGSRALGR